MINTRIVEIRLQIQHFSTICNNPETEMLVSGVKTSIFQHSWKTKPRNVDVPCALRTRTVLVTYTALAINL